MSSILKSVCNVLVFVYAAKEAGAISERCGFKVVLQWNKRYASDPILEPDLDQLKLHEEPVVAYRPLCHDRMSTENKSINVNTT